MTGKESCTCANNLSMTDSQTKLVFFLQFWKLLEDMLECSFENSSCRNSVIYTKIPKKKKKNQGKMIKPLAPLQATAERPLQRRGQKGPSRHHSWCLGRGAPKVWSPGRLRIGDGPTARLSTAVGQTQGASLPSPRSRDKDETWPDSLHRLPRHLPRSEKPTGFHTPETCPLGCGQYGQRTEPNNGETALYACGSVWPVCRLYLL